MQSDTRKIRLIYSYNGANFSGSQRQPHDISVEDALNLALNRVGIFEPIISSSRTDKGVHALSQVSTTHCLGFWNLERLRELINRHSHPYIHIKKIEFVSEIFHPRYDATSRSYAYILNHDTYKPFLADFCYFYPKIDLNSLNSSLEIFKGEHDFSNFMKVGSDTKSPIREISQSFAYRHKNLTIIKFRANGFLRSQVRLMVANALKSAKNGEKFSIDRAITRIPAPPNGLYLQRIFYDEGEVFMQNLIQNIKDNTHSIAIVGLSPDETKPSHIVAKFLLENGYKIYPIYPKFDEILGCRVYRDLDEIDDKIDSVVMFRKGEYAEVLIDKIINLGIKNFWLQLGIENKIAKEKAIKNSINFVENRCIMVEFKKLTEGKK